MGRPRKPNALKVLDGDQPCRINGDEPKSPPGLGEPPGWFDDAARSAWALLSDRLERMGVATRADSELATLYCTTFSMWRTASAVIAREGLTVETKTTTKAHPLFPIIHEAQRTMMRCLSQFGMTPVSRAGLKVPGLVEDDPLLAFLARPSSGPRPKPKPGV